MKKTNLKMTTVVMILFTFIACVRDWKADIAIMKNNTSSRILVAEQPYALMTDSILYFEQFSETWVEANQSRLITLPNIKLSYQADSVKCYLYVFNCDSIDKYRAIKKRNGIVKNSFIKKVDIQLNRVKQPLDTIYIK